MKISGIVGKLSVLALAGCVSTKEIDDGYIARAHAYDGRPIYELLAVLGAPDSQQRIGPADWYAWSYAGLASYGSAGYGDLQCKLSAAVDPAKGVIVHIKVLGNRGGCRTFLDRLK